mgnify:CR=1 FL=1
MFLESPNVRAPATRRSMSRAFKMPSATRIVTFRSILRVMSDDPAGTTIPPMNNSGSGKEGVVTTRSRSSRDSGVGHDSAAQTVSDSAVPAWPRKAAATTDARANGSRMGPDDRARLDLMRISGPVDPEMSEKDAGLAPAAGREGSSGFGLDGTKWGQALARCSRCPKNSSRLPIFAGTLSSAETRCSSILAYRAFAAMILSMRNKYCVYPLVAVDRSAPVDELGGDGASGSFRSGWPVGRSALRAEARPAALRGAFAPGSWTLEIGRIGPRARLQRSGQFAARRSENATFQ